MHILPTLFFSLFSLQSFPGVVCGDCHLNIQEILLFIQLTISQSFWIFVTHCLVIPDTHQTVLFLNQQKSTSSNSSLPLRQTIKDGKRLLQLSKLDEIINPKIVLRFLTSKHFSFLSWLSVIFARHVASMTFQITGLKQGRV